MWICKNLQVHAHFVSLREICVRRLGPQDEHHCNRKASKESISVWSSLIADYERLFVCWQSVGRNKFFEPFADRLLRSFLCFIVYMDQSKPFVIAQGPFEVV